MDSLHGTVRRERVEKGCNKSEKENERERETEREGEIGCVCVQRR